jgi:hypothetical protein
MSYKARIVKEELKILRFLNARMSISETEKKNLYRLEKGYEGEVMFDSLTEQLPDEKLILNDLLLVVNGTKFQIDSTIIVQSKIHLFEVKNFEGDYEYEGGHFQTHSENEISNPFDQLKRCESLFRQLLQKLGIKIPVEGKVIFINPEFTLYQAPKNQPYVLSTQLNRFMKKLIPTSSKLNSRHEKLAEELVSRHQIESPYARLRKYKYEELRKGVLCPSYDSFMESDDGKELVCKLCGAHEKVEAAVLRSVEELRLLFPDLKITTKTVQEWCQGSSISNKVIKRILDNNYKVVGSNRWIYYE